MKFFTNYKSLTSLIIILIGLNAQAKVFRNAYISFEMPESWKCNLEQTEWVCRSEQVKESKEAIIILTAKEVGPTDTLSLYEAHLSGPISTNIRGAMQTSKVVIKPTSININNQAWIDSLHEGSEINNYFTRYLATVKDRIAILVTLSAHKQFYTKYSSDFFKTVKSLQVIATKNIGQRPDLGPINPIGADPFGSITNGVPGDMSPELAQKKASSNKGLLGAALIVAALGIFLLIRARRKR